MEITEEVGRRRQEIQLESPERAYSELKDLLERRISSDEVYEEKYFNDIEEGRIRTKIILEEQHEKFTGEMIEIFLNIEKQKKRAEIQIKGKVETEYPTEKNYQQTLWYYAYRALFDKFLYGENRGAIEEDVEEKMDHILELVRDNLEADYSG
jgi:hypothetical protein